MMNMKIKEGYNSKPCEIKIMGRDNGHAEIWIENARKTEVGQDRDELLHYATIEEIKALRDECNDALKTMLGL